MSSNNNEKNRWNDVCYDDVNFLSESSGSSTSDLEFAKATTNSTDAKKGTSEAKV